MDQLTTTKSSNLFRAPGASDREVSPGVFSKHLKAAMNDRLSSPVIVLLQEAQCMPWRQLVEPDIPFPSYCNIICVATPALLQE